MFQAFAAETAGHASEGAAHAADVGFFGHAESWVLVAFVIVVGFVVLKFGGKVLAALDARSERIRSRLDEARTLREEAYALLAECEQKHKEAMRTADEIVEHARDEAERARKQAKVDLEEAIKRREKQAEDRIAQVEAQAIRDVRAQMVDVAVAAARRVIAERMDDQRQAALIDATIEDLPRRLH